MNIKRIIREEMGDDIVINILGNEYIVVRDNELKPYRKLYITEDEYNDLESFMDSIGITLRKFNYGVTSDEGVELIASMRYKMRDETLKRYIETMSGDIDFFND
jgi:hypothetical protein